MAERDSWATTGGIDQQDARMAVGALWTPGSSAIAAKTGFRPGPGSVTPGTVYASGTPDGNVHVQPFQAVLQTTRATPGGPFIMTLDSVKDINILSTPANATNPRNDLIIAHQSDTFYGDGDSLLRVRQVVGTPSATPSDPSLAAYPDAITLARVRVNASATTITSGNITDLRPSALYTVAVGGILPVASQAARDALTGYYNGFPVWRQDRKWVEVHDGTAWRVQGVPVVTSTADLSAITNPSAGMIAWNSGDDFFYRWSTTWRRADWAQSWGLRGGKRYRVGTGSFIGTNAGPSEFLPGMDSGSLTLLANRAYIIRATVRVLTASGAGTYFIGRVRETNLAGTVRAAFEGDFGMNSLPVTKQIEGWYEVGASDETKTLVVSGSTSAGVVNFYHGDDSVLVRVSVHDEGPSGVMVTV